MEFNVSFVFLKNGEIRKKSENLNNVVLLKFSHINIQIDNRTEKNKIKKPKANRKLDEIKKHL